MNVFEKLNQKAKEKDYKINNNYKQLKHEQ